MGEGVRWLLANNNNEGEYYPDDDYGRFANSVDGVGCYWEALLTLINAGRISSGC